MSSMPGSASPVIAVREEVVGPSSCSLYAALGLKSSSLLHFKFAQHISCRSDLSISRHSLKSPNVLLRSPRASETFSVKAVKEDNLFSCNGIFDRPWKTADTRLALEDGSIWMAKSFGARGTQVGEVVFNTSLTGYQEILTDPSYAGQFVLMTNPHIGNTGVNIGVVVAYDFGIKHNILRRLASYGCKITVVPSKWPAAETLEMKPDGVLFSNGPGDPSAVPYAVEIVEDLIGKVPLIGQALGGKTFKMKFGHHGGNHPVGNLRRGCVEISAQNHNYAIDPASLPFGVEVTHINLNDNSCAGLYFPEQKLMSLQYHPEASPGPHDSDQSFVEFIELMKSTKAQ
ncbi:hypothetical protein HPP92_024178 [Vanilla planifolia]|uniref:carbamoyl-phosphate synthase (glutamine-hydrolyzing) n=1 Tax=Vanilla planifolia TaxID=51239 RepID=A0A835PPT9_VANPL|nr:hypothetical protein HPP92_024178 [Vanilla planifolia]